MVLRRGGELEQLLRPDGRKGTSVLREDYEKLRAFILDYMDTDHGKTINELLEKAQIQFEKMDIAWLVLQVKLDLEARGYVRVFVPDHSPRINAIKITRMGQRFVRQQKSGSETT